MNEADKRALKHVVEFGALDEILAEVHLSYYLAWVDCADLAARELLHGKASALKDLKQRIKRVQNATD